MTDDRTERLVAYLLGELDDDARAAFAAELGRDPALRAEHDALAPVVTRLETLPDAAWEALPDGALPAPPAAPAPPQRGPRQRWWARRLVLRPAVAGAAALSLLAAGAGIGLLAGGSPQPDAGPTVAQTPAARLTLQPIGSAGPAAGGRIAVAAGDHGSARLRVQGLARQPGHFYELWLLDPDGKMVALGSFRVDAHGDAVVRVPLPVDPARYRYFDVSLQPDSGDPAHSGISVLRGSTRA